MTDATTQTQEAEKTEAKKRTAKGRSPAYPFIDLSKALEQTRALYGAEDKYAAPLPSAFDAWGYGEKSSGGRQTLAALRYFGLIDVEGQGDKRKVKVSDAALRILLDEREDQTERNERIRELALKPVIHAQLYDEYPKGLPSDASVRHYLTFDRGYNPDAAIEVLEEFKATAAFANLYQPGVEIDNHASDNEGGDSSDEASSFKVGDFVNWESGGQIQWKSPWKVVAVDTHENGDKYLQVEGIEGADAGQKGWIAMSDAIEPEAPATPEGASKVFTPPPASSVDGDDAPLAEGWEEERLIDDGGDEIFIRYEGKPTVERYEFIRDYLGFKIDRLKPKGGEPKKTAGDASKE